MIHTIGQECYIIQASHFTAGYLKIQMLSISNPAQALLGEFYLMYVVKYLLTAGLSMQPIVLGLPHSSERPRYASFNCA